VGGVTYWDIGVRGDGLGNNGLPNQASGFSLSPANSFLTTPGLYPNAHNSGSDPRVLSQYCNGSRVPPENGGLGFQVPPGTNETNALPFPVFQLTATATVDEGNNWINMRWGPLAQTNPQSHLTLGNYGIAAGSPAIGWVGSSGQAYTLAPSTDFFGNPRKPGAVDAGAVEFISAANRLATVSPSPLSFGNVPINTSKVLSLTVHNSGTVALTGGSVTGLPGGGFSQASTNCGPNLAVGASCTIQVRFSPTATGTYNHNVAVTYSGATVSPTEVSLTGNGT
jgi:hypothetical protein